MDSSAAVAEPAWLSERRERGKALVAELSLPGAKAPGWEFTDLSELDYDSFEGSRAVAIDGQAPLALPEDAAPELDVEGVTMMPLAEAAAERPELVEGRLGSVVSAEDFFVARNEAAWTDGVLLHVAAGTTVERPIVVGALDPGAGRALNWRTLVIVEEGAEVELWEQHAAGESAGAGGGLLNAVTEIIVGENATLRYVCGQDLAEESWIFATQRAEVARDGLLDWVAVGIGSGRGKVRMETKLAGSGSHARVTGALAGTGSQHLDYDTTQEHAAAHTESDLAFRGVLAGEATSVWRGMIRVDRDAQQTDAFQESRNLLLSTKAHADAIPGLEIEADDVRCTHAAAVAQVDQEQLFYLRSRGLGEAEAKRLVIEGFLAEVVQRTEEGPIREALADALERRLSELLDA